MKTTSGQSSPQLQVLIATFGRRLLGLVDNPLPEVEGVAYLISCQDPGNELEGTDIRPLMERGDIDLRIYRDRGLSLNRNHAFDAASAPYLLIADDDLDFLPDGLRKIIDAFNDNPRVDVALLKADVPLSRREFPPEECDLPHTWPRHHAISFEIAVRRSSWLSSGIRFSPLAGIGAPRLGAGEEELFLHQARRRGLTVRYYPITHAVHPGPTTSKRSARSAAVLRAKGTVITALRGPFTALTHFPVEAARSKAPFFKALWCYLDGMVYYFTHRSQLI